MSRDLHGGGCIHTRVDEVADGRATEIMGDEPLVLKPSFACLFSESTLNTRLLNGSLDSNHCRRAAIANSELYTLQPK